MHLDRDQRDPGGRRRHPQLIEYRHVGRVVHVPQEGEARDRGDRLLEELQSLGTEIRAEDGIAGDVFPGLSQARDQPGPDRIADADHDDRDGGGRLLGRAGRRRTEGRDQVDRAADQRRRRRCQPVGLPFPVAIFEGDVPALLIAEIAQAAAERVPYRRVVEDADARNFRQWLLSARRERPDGRAGDKRDQLASSDSTRTGTYESSLSHGLLDALLPEARILPK